MTGVDFAVAGILLISVFLGFWRGLIYEVMALLGWPIAFLASKLFAGELASRLPSMQEPIRVATSYAVMFIVVLITWAILTRLISKLIKVVGAGWVDRVLGGLFGIFRGVFVVMILVWMVGLSNFSEHKHWREASISRSLENVALLTKSWLPDIVEQRIHYENRH
jgi:membrane protein required for colicin V production